MMLKEVIRFEAEMSKDGIPFNKPFMTGREL
jgi:hypothetical protein